MAHQPLPIIRTPIFRLHLAEREVLGLVPVAPFRVVVAEADGLAERTTGQICGILRVMKNSFVNHYFRELMPVRIMHLRMLISQLLIR